MKRVTSCQVSRMAQANPFMAFGQNANLTQVNPGVSWSIVDPNNLLMKTTSFCPNRAKDQQQYDIKTAPIRENWKNFCSFEHMKPHATFKQQVKQLKYLDTLASSVKFIKPVNGNSNRPVTSDGEAK